MTAAEQDGGFARETIPDSALGPARRVFFIVAGSLCGLPVLLLAAQVGRALGLHAAIEAFLLGAAASGTLGALSAAAGARTRMNVSLLAEHSFGRRGALLLKLVIAASLIGWFGVIVSVLGATVAATLASLTGLAVPPSAIALVLAALVALAALRGVVGLERLGLVLVPLMALVLFYAVLRTAPSLGAMQAQPAGGLSFSAAVSAVTGSYIVGILIQPDYGRFVRRPLGAFFATGAALGVVYPVVLVLSAIPTMVLDKSDLIAASLVLGIGVPALLLLLLGAWIDASACLYSGSLSIANQFARLRLQHVILGSTAFGMVLALAHAEAYFLPFLGLLGTLLPPVAVVQIVEGLTGRFTTPPFDAAPKDIRWSSCAAWAIGSCAGFAGTEFGASLTGVTALDSIVATALVLGVVKLGGRSRDAVRA